MGLWNNIFIPMPIRASGMEFQGPVSVARRKDSLFCSGFSDRPIRDRDKWLIETICPSLRLRVRWREVLLRQDEDEEGDDRKKEDEDDDDATDDGYSE
jgi:hypothetical protein